MSSVLEEELFARCRFQYYHHYYRRNVALLEISSIGHPKYIQSWWSYSGLIICILDQNLATLSISVCMIVTTDPLLSLTKIRNFYHDFLKHWYLVLFIFLSIAHLDPMYTISKCYRNIEKSGINAFICISWEKMLSCCNCRS